MLYHIQVVGYVPVDNQLCGGGGGDVIVAMETRALLWRHVRCYGDTWCHDVMHHHGNG